jgi:ADP-ribosylglycohydrolase
MRCGILGILGFTTSDYLKYVTKDCMITNPSPLCIEINRIYVELIYLALNGKDKTILKNTAIIRLGKIPLVDEYVMKAINKEDVDITTIGKGWCIYGLYCAIYSLLHFDNYHDAINWTILKGGDTDTNAKIAGDLLGAFYGLNKIKENDVTKNNLSIMLKTDPSKGDFDRSVKYTLTNINYLLDNLVKIINKIVFNK